MTTPTVANHRLQDATKTQLSLLLDPWLPSISILDHEGDWTTLYSSHLEEDRVTHIIMSAITVDGVRYRKRDDYGFRLFTVKDDGTHSTDADGYCFCEPTKYTPLTYRAGEVCDRCWMAHGFVTGIGKDGCNHK